MHVVVDSSCLFSVCSAERDVKVRKRTLTEVTSVSSAGIIPKAKIRTIKMTFLIVLSQYSASHMAYHSMHLSIVLYCIVSIHLYSASCSAHQSEALPV